MAQVWRPVDSFVKKLSLSHCLYDGFLGLKSGGQVSIIRGAPVTTALPPRSTFCVFKFESGSFYGGQVFNGKFHDRLKTGSTLFCMGIYNNMLELFVE